MLMLGMGLLAPVAFGLMCVALRGYTFLWLGLCVVATVLMALSPNTGGCDGGLCLLKYMLLPPIWIGLWLLVLLVRLAARKADATGVSKA